MQVPGPGRDVIEKSKAKIIISISVISNESERRSYRTAIPIFFFKGLVGDPIPQIPSL